MKLKDDLERDKDFILVSQAVWQKLIHTFGGAPEIYIFMISRSIQQVKAAEEEPDLSPITIQLLLLD